MKEKSIEYFIWLSHQKRVLAEDEDACPTIDEIHRLLNKGMEPIDVIRQNGREQGTPKANNKTIINESFCMCIY